MNFATPAEVCSWLRWTGTGRRRRLVRTLKRREQKLGIQFLYPLGEGKGRRYRVDFDQVQEHCADLRGMSLASFRESFAAHLRTIDGRFAESREYVDRNLTEVRGDIEEIREAATSAQDAVLSLAERFAGIVSKPE